MLEKYNMGPSSALSRHGGRNHIKRSHHLVIFMLEDVAVPHIAAGETFKSNDDSRHHSWIGPDRIFPARLARLRSNRRPRVFNFPICPIRRSLEAPAVENLKPDQMQVYRVGIVRQIDEISNLNCIEDGILRHRHVPVDIVQQHRYRPLH